MPIIDFAENSRLNLKRGIPKDIVVQYALNHLTSLNQLPETTEDRNKAIAHYTAFLQDFKSGDLSYYLKVGSFYWKDCQKTPGWWTNNALDAYNFPSYDIAQGVVNYWNKGHAVVDGNPKVLLGGICCAGALIKVRLND